MDPTRKESAAPSDPVTDIPPSAPAAPSQAATMGRTHGITLWQYIVLVAAGAFATTFAQQRVLGNLPTTFLLKDHLKLAREDVAFFFFVATFAWNLKPFAGILTDAFPLFRTRRKSYMVLGAAGAGVFWIVMSLFPDDKGKLLWASVGMNVATVFASTVMGGLMVEAGQAFSAPGRISALRQVVQSISGILGPMLGGMLAANMLAGKTFHATWWSTTMYIAAGAVFLLAILSAFVLREKPVQRPASVVERPHIRIPMPFIIGLLVGALIGSCLFFDLHHLPALNKDTWKLGVSVYALVGMFILIIGLMLVPTYNPVIVKAQGQLSQILESRTLWLAVFMLFLVYTVPGFNTALTYRQEDVMKFDQGFIGRLGSIEGAFGVIAALLYAAFCRKLNLRILLIGGVGVNAATTLLYLFYHEGTSRTAIQAIHATGGFWVVISELALMDLAVRSTPAGCEALGFALMMSIRNFGIAVSDLLGSKMLDSHVLQSVLGKGTNEFNTMVIINASTTMIILFFVPLLPRLVMSRREGESMEEPEKAIHTTSAPAEGG